MIKGAVPRSDTIVICPPDAPYWVRKQCDEKAPFTNAYSMLNKCVGYMSAGQTMRLLPGTYTLGDTWSVNKAINLYMRGAKFVCPGGSQVSPIEFVGSGRTGDSIVLSSDADMGSREIVLATTPSATFAVGEYVQITDETLKGEYNDKKAEIVKIRYIDDATRTVVFSESLRYDYLTSATARLRKLSLYDNCVVDGGFFDGPSYEGSDAYYTGPKYAWHSNLTVKHQWIRHFSDYGLYIGNTVDSRFEKITSERNARQGFGYGMALYGNNCNLEIVSPRLRDNRHSIMAGGQDSANYGGPNSICIKHAWIKAIGLDSYKGSNFDVSSIDCHETWADDWHIDDCDFLGVSNPTGLAVRSVLITNCRVEGATKDGFSDRVNSVGIMERLIIRNCSIKGCGGICYVGSTNIKYIEVTNVDVEVTTPKDYLPLIYTAASACGANTVVRLSHINITGTNAKANVISITASSSPKPLIEIDHVNTGKSSQCGIMLNGWRGQLSHCYCDNGNQRASSTDNQSSGIYLENCTDMEVEHCSACDLQGSHTQRKGIMTVNCDYLRLHDNHVEGNTVSQITKTGSNSKQWHNWPGIASDALW